MTDKPIGQRMTSQRKLLLEIIRNSNGHLEADEILRLAREKDDRISLSTVYRNLNLLKESGLVVERHLGEEHHHYELNTGPDHQHLICTECGDVFEFKSQFGEKMMSEAENASKFKITHIEIDMIGLCPGCQKNKPVGNQLSIAQMASGQTGRIVEIGRGSEMKRVEAMGLRIGKDVTKIGGMLGRGPVTVQAGRTQLAIGHGMAQKIMVEVKSI